MSNGSKKNSLVRIMVNRGLISRMEGVRAERIALKFPDACICDLLVDHHIASRETVERAREIQRTEDGAGYLYDVYKHADRALDAVRRSTDALDKTLARISPKIA